MLKRPASRVPEVRVDCGACRACCHQAVILTEDEQGLGYHTESIATPQGVFHFLERRQDGGCVYLTSDGCGIHEDRPACCRRFDCGAWYNTVPRALRKEIQRNGDPKDKRMLREGRKRSRGGTHAF